MLHDGWKLPWKGIRVRPGLPRFLLLLTLVTPFVFGFAAGASESPITIPEPATALLFGSGLFGLALRGGRGLGTR